MKHRFIYILLLGLLFAGCSKEPQMSAAGDMVAIDFTCDGITRSGDDPDVGTDYMFTLVAASNSGKPVSDVYSSVGSTLTPQEKILAVNNATYRLVIASPAEKMVALDAENSETSAYGYKVERNGAYQPYINNTPISVVVDGIKANNAYTHNLSEVTLKEQRSKVKVQFRVIDEEDARTLTKLYYTKVYNAAYTCPNSGWLYGDNLPNNDVYEFTAFSNNGTGSKTYTNTELAVEPTSNDDDATYFISGDYTDLSEGKTPYLCIGLQQDGEEKLIEMPLDIVMEPMMSYTYDIKISSTELTVNVTTDKWQSGGDISGGIGESVGSFTIDIATGVVSEWTEGSDAGGNVVPPTIVLDPEEEVDFTDDNSSNCYILNPSQDKTMIYYIPIKRIDEFWGDTNYVADGANNTLASVGDNWEAVIFWHDFSNPNSSEAISTLTVEKSVVPNTTTPAVKVTLPKEFYDPLNHCNVGFLVRKIDTKEVLWSWHLWITDYDPSGLIEQYQNQITANTAKAYGETVNGRKNEVHRYNGTLWVNDGIYSDKFIMDRNLGARSPDFEGQGAILSNTVTTVGGLHYQYGRKDPFPPFTIRSSDYPYSVANGPVSLSYTVHSPYVYIGANSKENWCTEAYNTPSEDYIWNDYKIARNNYSSGKSIFDPSPLGFRIPIGDTWKDFTTNNMTFTSNYGGQYSDFAYFPFSGNRSYNQGTFSTSTTGYLWSGSTSTTNSYQGTLFSYSNSQVYIIVKERSSGNAIRPIQE